MILELKSLKYLFLLVLIYNFIFYNPYNIFNDLVENRTRFKNFRGFHFTVKLQDLKKDFIIYIIGLSIKIFYKYARLLSKKI